MDRVMDLLHEARMVANMPEKSKRWVNECLASALTSNMTYTEVLSGLALMSKAIQKQGEREAEKIGQLPFSIEGVS